MILLPQVFAIWRHNKPNENNWNAVLVRTQLSRNHTEPVWNFTLIENPLEYLGNSILTQCSNDIWFNDTFPRISIERPSSDPERHLRVYTTTFYFQKYHIYTIRQDDPIPVLTCTNKCLILPSAFTNLDHDCNQRWRFEMRSGPLTALVPSPDINDLRRVAYQEATSAASAFLRSQYEPIRFADPVPLVSSGGLEKTNKIPQIIVNGYIENTVSKGDMCPITMAPLEKESACLTPCGHTMLFSAAECWIRDAHSCPVCREHLLVEHLQVWKP
jgi:hypothetical protein